VVIAAIATALIFWVKTTDFTGSPYRVKAYFNYADGVKQDSIVKLSGIEVGRVEKVSFVYNPDTKVEVVLNIKEGARIHEDSIAFISTSGMIGDAYIGLTPGSADRPFAKNGAVVVSEDPVEMRKLMKKAEAISEGLEATLNDVKKLVGENKAGIGNIVTNLEATSANFKEFSEDIKQHPWKLLMKK
jgi:phospholipid/cholesterol/gamma-HCH transport system substrate-binding protein